MPTGCAAARIAIFYSGRLWRYSLRSALIGEIDAALLAGIRAATNAEAASAPAAIINASGSQLETP
jgi:hypothetical protein